MMRPAEIVAARAAFGWPEDGAFIGMHGFGASAPAPMLYEKFGITAEAVARAARQVFG